MINNQINEAFTKMFEDLDDEQNSKYWLVLFDDDYALPDYLYAMEAESAAEAEAFGYAHLKELTGFDDDDDRYLRFSAQPVSKEEYDKFCANPEDKRAFDKAQELLKTWNYKQYKQDLEAKRTAEALAEFEKEKRKLARGFTVYGVTPNGGFSEDYTNIEELIAGVQKLSKDENYIITAIRVHRY